MPHHHIFSQVYFLYKLEQHLDAKRILLEKYQVSDSDLARQWNCNSTVINVRPDELLPLITPALREFGKDVGKSVKVFVEAAWINFYKTGAFQELHNHVGRGCQLALVYFLSYDPATDGKFYFYNTNTEMVSADLTTLLSGPVGTFGSVVYPEVSEGDVLLFPSHLHHGVGPHQGENLRITVSCNLSFRVKQGRA